MLRERGVREPRAQALVDLLGRPHAGEDGGQRGVETVRDELRELLARPRRLRVAVEVVEHGQWSLAKLVAEAVVGNFGVAAVRGAQAVEEVGDGEEERGAAEFDRAVGDGGGEMGLAAAGHAAEDQPALGIFGEAASGLDGDGVALLRGRVGRAPVRQQCLEAEAGERAEARVAQQPLPPRALVLAVGTVARHGAPEVGAREIGGDAHEARAAAERAGRLAIRCRWPGVSCGG